MAETPYNHYALYEPDAAPDLTASGEYNSAVMAIDADMHAEAATRHDEDDRLDKAIAAVGRRVDNAEVEISANSADLTGIKGLTYGEQHVHFVENSDGEYSSPALEEIAEQVTALEAAGWSTLTIESYAGTLTQDALTQLKSHWPHVMVSVGGINLLYPMTFIGHEYTFLSTLPSTRGKAYADGLSVNGHTGEHKEANTYYAPYWDKVSRKPFSTIGSGLQIRDGALTIDPSIIPKGITARTTWGELESELPN